MPALERQRDLRPLQAADRKVAAGAGGQPGPQPALGAGEDRDLRRLDRAFAGRRLQLQLALQVAALDPPPEQEEDQDNSREGSVHGQDPEMDLEQRHRSGAEREEGQPGIPGEVGRDGGEPAAGDREDLPAAARELARDADPRPHQRGVGGVAEEEVEDLPVVPLEPGGVRPEERVQVGHVADRFHEVEAQPDRGAVDDAVDDVVELVAHDEVEEENGHPLRQLFEETRRKGVGRVQPRPGEEGVDGPGLEEPLHPDDQGGRDDGAPCGCHQHQPPGLLLLSVEAVHHPEAEAGRGQAGQRREGRRRRAGLPGEEEDVEQQQPEQEREREKGRRPEPVAPAIGRVVLEGAKADPGGARHQGDGGQAEQRAPAGDPVEREVAEGRAGDEDQEEHGRQGDRQPVAGGPPVARIGGADRDAHVRSTSISRRASTSTGCPCEMRSTTNR